MHVGYGDLPNTIFHFEEIKLFYIFLTTKLGMIFHIPAPKNTIIIFGVCLTIPTKKAAYYVLLFWKPIAGNSGLKIGSLEMVWSESYSWTT